MCKAVDYGTGKRNIQNNFAYDLIVGRWKKAAAFADIAYKYDEHKDEFDQQGDFQFWRNSLGALILLPQGTNQSFSSDKYEAKLKHYLKENTLAQALHPDFYAKNPNFNNSPVIKSLNFKAHPKFQKKDVEEREQLVKRICESLWSTDYFKG